MGFGYKFLVAIQAIYSQPKAQLKVNGLSSSLFSLARGTRQSDPLLPFLFALAMEPLTGFIQQHPLLKDVKVRDREFRLSLYADDLVVYLTAFQPYKPY